MEPIYVCCNVYCPLRLECAKFSRALDVNVGKIVFGYAEVNCEGGKQFEREKRRG